MDIPAMITAISNLNPWLVGLIVIVLYKSKDFILAIYNKKTGKGKSKKHSDCENFHDLKSVINTYIKIDRIRESETLNEQMDLVDRYCLKVNNIEMNEYKSILDYTKPFAKRDERAFKNIVYKMLIEMKPTIKQWIKKNHLLDMTDKEFEEYKKETAKDILEESQNILDEEYLDEDFIISRDEVKKHNDENIVNEIYVLIQEMLFNIREIAKDKAIEIKKLKESINE